MRERGCFSLIPAVINLVLNIIMIALPMSIFWKLRMPTWRKIVVRVIFGMGTVKVYLFHLMFRTIHHSTPNQRIHNRICMITLFRIIALIRLDTTDFSYSIVNTTIWSSLEPCLGIMMVCLSVLQSTMAKVFGDGALAWARRPSKTSTTPGTWPGGFDRRPSQTKILGNGRFHRLYDVGNLLGSCHCSLPSLAAVDEHRSWLEPEAQSIFFASRGFRISRGWQLQPVSILSGLLILLPYPNPSREMCLGCRKSFPALETCLSNPASSLKSNADSEIV